MVRTSKPKPIRTSLSRKPAKKAVAPPVPEQASPVFNQDSPIVTKQIAKAQKKIATLENTVHELSSREVPTAPTPIVNIPPRARIAKVVIKYDPFGAPMELIPKYTKAEV